MASHTAYALGTILGRFPRFAALLLNIAIHATITRSYALRLVSSDPFQAEQPLATTRNDDRPRASFFERNLMFALAYTSEAISPFDESALSELAQVASAKNRKLEITGYLHYDFVSESFFQYLEGARSSVEALMSTIEQDPRHRIISLLPILNEERLAAIRQSSPDAFVAQPTSSERESPPSSEIRLFPHWTMRLVYDGDFQRCDLGAELVDALVLMRQQSSGRAAAVNAVARLSEKLAARCHGSVIEALPPPSDSPNAPPRS